MIKLDFEFISTHRNRNLWPNPCLFEIPWSGNGQSIGLNALDPISNQVPIISWTGQNININANVVLQTTDVVVVSAPENTFSKETNFYQGCELNIPPSTRINNSKFLAQHGGLEYIQFNVSNSTGVQVGNIVTIQNTSIPNTMYVPAGSELTNAYTSKYLYNETLGESTIISGYDSDLHKVLATIPNTWTIIDQYSIRSQLPTVSHFGIGNGNTITTLNVSGINTNIALGDFVRIISTGEIVKIINFDSITSMITVTPSLSMIFPVGTIIEILTQTMDNYRTLCYSGTTVGQQEQVSYDINLVSASIPNVLIKNGSGGYAYDYPFLYIELYDTNYPSQNNLFSNNHSNKSYFKVTTPTGQLFNRSEKFTKFTGDLSHKTIRFRPTSNFRVVWRLPSNEEIQFEEYDTQSPYSPNEFLQTSVKFSLKRD